MSDNDTGRSGSAGIPAVQPGSDPKQIGALDSPQPRGSIRGKRLYLLLGVGLALIVCLTVFCSEFKLAIVVGESMLPTLRSGDVLIVDRRAYEQTDPGRGDIIVARYGKDWVVKRIVGLPGEEVEVRKGTLFIDGMARTEEHATEKGSLDVASGRLLAGDFATLGDNRAVPAVLAVHPILSRSEMLGKVIFSVSFLPARRAPGQRQL